MDFISALRDPNLLGASPAFRSLEPWDSWLTFAAATYGLDLDDASFARFRKATGRTRYDPPPGGYDEVGCIVGRQAGKTQIAAAIIAYEAAFAPPCRDGELYALLLAQDHRAAMRTAFAYIASIFEASPILRRMVVRRTVDTLTLQDGVRVAAYPCRPQAVRGLRACVAVADELAHFRSTEMIPQDLEMLRALRPCLATTGGKLFILSSPHGQIGALWDLHRRHHGRDDSRVLVWQASAPEMNPTLQEGYLERMREDDPEAYRSEVLGEFRAGLTTLFDPDALEACVARDHRELLAAPELEYRAFADPSGGRGDAFSLAIGHRDGERIVVDLVRARKPPFNPSDVIHEYANLLKCYGVSRVTGDRYGGEFPRELFRAHNIEYDLAEKTKSELYLSLLADVNSGRVELRDDPDLLRELRALERRRGRSGRDTVDHPPGAHDDLANALAGVVHELRRDEEPVQLW